MCQGKYDLIVNYMVVKLFNSYMLNSIDNFGVGNKRLNIVGDILKQAEYCR